ncbi:DUF2688 domain-containing protein [Citrobacter freundii]|uniref:DUF2688 domain-containing protein n=2 Tax=Citrobacter freundii TaxID=546 RepID=UPI002FCD98FB
MYLKAGYITQVRYRRTPMKKSLVHTHCRRCGCSLIMSERSIWGADALKAELGQICADCLTPEEHHRICTEIMELAVRRVCRPTLTLQRRGH